MATLTIQPDNVAGVDTMIANLYIADSNYSTFWGLMFGTRYENSVFVKNRAFLMFDLSVIPFGSDIESIVLYLSHHGSFPFTGEKIAYAYRVTRTDMVITEVTWNSYKEGSAWTVPGGDFTAVDHDRIVIEGRENISFPFLKAQGDYAIANTAGKMPILITGPEEANIESFYSAFSSNNGPGNVIGQGPTDPQIFPLTNSAVYSDITLRPRLVIEYTAPPAVAQNAGGRLTLLSGNPVPSADVTVASTLYYTPFVNDTISLFANGLWSNFGFPEISLALTGLTVTNPYDVFIYSNSGVPTLQTVAWSSPTARATALARVGGTLVKSGDPTKRYIGTIQMSATSQCEDSAAKRYVYNQYNKMPRTLRVKDATANWSYNSATLHAANASNSNRVALINGGLTGIAELEVDLEVSTLPDLSGAKVAIGVDSVTTAHADCVISSSAVAAIIPTARLNHHPAIGFHYFQWLESGLGPVTFSGGTLSGITGSVSI